MIHAPHSISRRSSTDTTNHTRSTKKIRKGSDEIGWVFLSSAFLNEIIVAVLNRFGVIIVHHHNTN